MTKFIEVTGKTEDEALSSALRQLGLERDDVSVELIERAKSGFLGLGSSPARIRVSYEAPDEAPVAAKAESAAEEKKSVAEPAQAAAAPAVEETAAPAAQEAPAEIERESPASATGQWTCPACGGANTGKFCEYCGSPRP